MSELLELIRGYSKEIEMRLRLQMEIPLRRSLIRTELPQSWNFKTEKEEIYFTLGKNGSTSSGIGQTPDPDITIEWKHDYLVSILRNKTLEGIPAGEEPIVTIHTIKGKLGLVFLRRYLRFP